MTVWEVGFGGMLVAILSDGGLVMPRRGNVLRRTECIGLLGVIGNDKAVVDGVTECPPCLAFWDVEESGGE